MIHSDLIESGLGLLTVLSFNVNLNS
jgi:hypothetical protein